MLRGIFQSHTSFLFIFIPLTLQMECSKRAFVHSRVTSVPTRSTQSTHTNTDKECRRVGSAANSCCQHQCAAISGLQWSCLRNWRAIRARRAQSTSSTKLRKTKRRLHLHRKICRNITKLINNTTAAEATTPTTTAIEMPNSWAESVHSRPNRCATLWLVLLSRSGNNVHCNSQFMTQLRASLRLSLSLLLSSSRPLS